MKQVLSNYWKYIAVIAGITAAILVFAHRNGYLDLYVVNYVDSLKVCRDARGQISTCDPQDFGAQQDRLYVNTGAGQYEEVTSSAGIVAADGKGLGVVIADFDEDGWPDIFVANDQFHGTIANRDAIGTRLIVRTEGGTQQRELAGGDGFYSSNERRQFIGLGQATRVEQLEIHWPTGDTDVWEDLPVNCQLTVTQGSSPRVARKFND